MALHIKENDSPFRMRSLIQQEAFVRHCNSMFTPAPGQRFLNFGPWGLPVCLLRGSGTALSGGSLLPGEALAPGM